MTLPVRKGQLNFMRASAAASLYRNGAVMIDRDPAGNTRESKGLDTEQRELDIFDARHCPTPMSCEVNGFELQHQPLPDSALDFLDHDSVLADYYPACERIVAAATGAEAFAFDHNIRSAGGKQAGRAIKGGQDVQGPAHIVHGDYTLRGAPERLQQLASPPAGNDTLNGRLPDGTSLISPALTERALNGGRFAIINVWRNIDTVPVAAHPLALCDGQTVIPEDLVVFEIHYPNRIGENYFSKAADRHRFYYYPEMTRDEVLLIKQWDSAGRLAQTGGREGDQPGEPCTFSFHSAFTSPDENPQAPDRWSIEVRCMVVYDVP